MLHRIIDRVETRLLYCAARSSGGVARLDREGVRVFEPKDRIDPPEGREACPSSRHGGPDSLINRMFLVQLLIALGASALGSTRGLVEAYSALLGSVLSIVPNACFAFMVFGRHDRVPPGRELYQLYRAEVIKLLLVALLFAAVFRLVDELNVVALMISFIVVHASGLLVSMSAKAPGSARAAGDRPR